jgi:hypothetical protein
LIVSLRNRTHASRQAKLHPSVGKLDAAIEKMSSSASAL